MLSLTNQTSIIIVGCGFLGKATASLFLEKGYSVIGIARSQASCEPSAEASLKLLSADVTNIKSLEALRPQLPPSSTLIYAVSSGKGDASVYSAVYCEGLKNVLLHWKPHRLIFVSSTSVYAQLDGSWVTETSATQPERATSRLLLDAEKIALSAGGNVARFSGIYGPNRSVLLKKFLQNEAVLEEGGYRWINQIHRDDGAHALYHLATSPAPSGIYNVTDNTPATQREVYEWIAHALHKPLPPDGPANYNRKRGWTSKRISNEKLRNTGWAPQFPSYQEALATLIEQSSDCL